MSIVLTAICLLDLLYPFGRKTMINITVLNCSPEYPEELMTILAERDYSASLCSLDGKVPARHIGGQKPHLIICPSVNTYSEELFKSLERILLTIHVPVLFIIERPDERFFHWLSRTGNAASYIKEPFTESELVHSVMSLVRSCKMQPCSEGHIRTNINAVNILMEETLPGGLEEKLRLIIESIDDVIWILDKEGRFLYLSPSERKMTGYSPEELMQRPLQEILTPASFEIVRERMRTFFADMKQGVPPYSTGVLELEQFRKDGSTVWIDVTVSPIFDDGGNFRFFLGVSRNINERKKLEAELQKQKQVLGAIFDHAPIAMMLVNSEGRVQNINHTGIESIEKQREDVLGALGGAALCCVNSFREGGCGATENCAECDIRNTFTETFTTGKACHKVEGTLGVIHGGELSTRHLLISTARIGLNGDSYVMLSLDDITESKKARMILQESEERLATLYENMPGGTLIIGPDYIIEDVNSRTCELTGYKREELIGQLCDILCPKGSSSMKCPIWEEGLECFQGMDTTIKCKDGRRNPILKNATRITMEGKTYILENFQDISRQKEAEEALTNAKLSAEAANRTKSEFLASMSHELRTPLNAVIGYSDMLLEGAFGEMNDRQRRSLGHILSSGKHLLEVINDILDLSKVESGKMELYYENFQVLEVLRNVGNIVSLLAKRKNISLFMSAQPESLRVSADKIRVKQILYNLISNSIKFTPENGYVRIDAYEADGMLELSVSDNGIGISEEDQKKLFIPFSQVYSGTSRHYDGTGLGLSLVRKFVEMHGGSITLESIEGKGTTFTIRIPLEGNENRSNKDL
ncbi:MAG: hypothetical protein PWP14_1693 [Methanolobus sp.]|nr:hypothetical protein [Methanolobus sp.]